MEKIGKAELADQVQKLVPRATKAEISDVISGLIEAIKTNLKQGNKVSLKEFMTMEPVRTKERTGRNPSTGSTMVIPAKNAVKFKISPSFKKSLN